MAARIAPFVLPVVLAAVSWILLGFLGMAIEAPIQAFARWVTDTFGMYGELGFIAALVGVPGLFALWAMRRDRARQYATDRTIHVERHWTPARKRAVLWSLLLVALIALPQIIYDALIR